MLLVSTPKMNRKAIALTIVLLLAGLAPASAIIGFCTRMPCCSHAASGTAAAFSAERTDCCTTITCYDVPSAKLTNLNSSANVALSVPARVAVAVIAPTPAPTRELIDTSPPASPRHRLALLSILLI